MDEHLDSSTGYPKANAWPTTFHFERDSAVANKAISNHIDRYHLIEILGEGGMGTVWLAEQQAPLRRRVALKLIKGGIGSHEIIARFETERQTLALMEHDNIAKVLDAGTTEHGLPYFSMEYVDGQPIQEFCDQRMLSIGERLELFRELCLAIDHAHQKGVVHRDLKPSNVLVSTCNERPTVKVIDFGIAKALQRKPTVSCDTLLTEIGSILGTYPYMSPEQARGETTELDPRADVYSLGIILYELLTGEPPITINDLRTLSQQTLLEMITKVTPPRPSHRVGQSQRRRELLSIDSRSQPANGMRNLRARLDWVVLKSLEKEPQQRYASAREFADDVGRVLDGKLTHANPPSRLTRIYTAIHHHRRKAIACLLLSLIAAIVCGLAGIALDLHFDNQRRSRNELNLAISALENSRGDSVAQALSNLERFPSDEVLPALRSKLDSSPKSDTSRLSSAYGLARFGDERSDELIQWVDVVDSQEIPNLTRAFRSAPDSNSRLLRRAQVAENDSDWDQKARIAILLLHLGQPEVAEEMCQPSDDATQRSAFIDIYSKWNPGADEVSGIIQDVASPDVRTAAAFACAGFVDDELTTAQRARLHHTLQQLYQEQTPVLHSAADYALRSLKLEITSTPDSHQGNSWYIDSIGNTMILIPAGFFTRDVGVGGSVQEQEVHISNSFYMADKETALFQYQQFMKESDPSDALVTVWPGMDPTYQFDEFGNELDMTYLPVQNISWYDAIAFCNWLSRREGLTPAYERTDVLRYFSAEREYQWTLLPEANGYRLPTEAEFEYASRAGTKTKYFFGPEKYLEDYAVCRVPRNERRGSRMPNPWGLFDLAGSLNEWCEDWYDELPRQPTLTDPRGPQEGEIKILRGGGWNLVSAHVDSNDRNTRFFPTRRYWHNGFRYVRNAQ